jgi:5-methylcytosine-specific restriction endonuclease McrA
MLKSELIERAARFRSAVEDPSRICPIARPLSSMPIIRRFPIIRSACGPGRPRSRRCSSNASISSPAMRARCTARAGRCRSPRSSRCANMCGHRNSRPSPASTCSCAIGFRASIAAAPQQLTFDHVVPRRLGGRTSWENILTACAPCNLKKGGRTPGRRDAAAVNPIRPTNWQLQERGRAFPPNYLHETWRDWLYWDVELEALCYPLVIGNRLPWLCLVTVLGVSVLFGIPPYWLLFAIGVAVFRAKTGKDEPAHLAAIIFILSIIMIKFDFTKQAIAATSTAAAIYFCYSVRFDGKIWRSLLWLGTISYSLYLTHLPIGGRVVNLGRRYLPADWSGELALSTVALMVSLVSAAVFHRMIERPAIKASRTIA